MQSIKGKWALVTGADGGIGLEFCRALAERGSNVLMVSNRADTLISAARKISDDYGINTVPYCTDLTAADTSERIFDFLKANNIDITILINNAGIFSFAPVNETPKGKLDCFIDLHVRAVTQLSRDFANYFAAKKEGYILNMSSMSCWTPMPGIGMYSATKAFIRVFTRALHYEMRESGVKVMVACPGGIATDLFGLPDNLMRLALHLGAVTTPQKFTRNALKRLLKGKKQYINGLINRMAILFVGITPTPVRMMIKHLMLDKGIRR